jgi:hypothetical protein
MVCQVGYYILSIQLKNVHILGKHVCILRDGNFDIYETGGMSREIESRQGIGRVVAFLKKEKGINDFAR